GLLLVPLGNFFQLSFFDVWTRLPERVLAINRPRLLDTTKGRELTYRPRSERLPLEPILTTLQTYTSTQPPEAIRASIYSSWYHRTDPDACDGLWHPLSVSNLVFLGIIQNIPVEIAYAICAEEDSIVGCLEEQTELEFIILERNTAWV